MRTLAIIPARSGSKGIPHKNFRLFCGKRLLDWAVEIGLKTCDSVLVTSDVEVDGLPSACQRILRPEHLSTDTSGMLGVVEHALSEHRRVGGDPDVIVLLQPTSPLRRPYHVEHALETLVKIQYATAVASVVMIPPHMSPDYAMFIEDAVESVETAPDGSHVTVPRLLLRKATTRRTTRRQDCRQAFYRDGTVYAIRRSTIESGSLYGPYCFPFIIPKQESATIDTEDDWERAEALMREGKGATR
jgi:CMP-N-acetylneuraminic acid synthetase